ncbi:MAG: hypothetical protein HYX36_00290 [Rhizobiales bacterium]|nr:hypothetical protein [Hyphomicrobiales bacterium]
MKKLVLVAATLVMFAPAAFADQNNENNDKMDAKRQQFYAMTAKMMQDEMVMLKKQEAMLTNYMGLLKQMMENESNKK